MEAAPMVFPVRYVSEGAAIQTTSRGISSEGIAVRSLIPPRVGARVSLALYLPGNSKPEVAVGVVSAATPARPASACNSSMRTTTSATASIATSNDCPPPRPSRTPPAPDGVGGAGIHAGASGLRQPAPPPPRQIAVLGRYLSAACCGGFATGFT